MCESPFAMPDESQIKVVGSLEPSFNLDQQKSISIMNSSIKLENGLSYTLDEIWPPNSHTRLQDTINQWVNQFLVGYDSTIVCYGPRSSSNMFTMPQSKNSQEYGAAALAISRIFGFLSEEFQSNRSNIATPNSNGVNQDHTKSTYGMEIICRASFVAIRQNETFDLFGVGNNAVKPKLGGEGLYLENAVQLAFSSANEIIEAIKRGDSKRSSLSFLPNSTQKSTEEYSKHGNRTSVPVHAVLRIELIQSCTNGSYLSSQLLLVDLVNVPVIHQDASIESTPAPITFGDPSISTLVNVMKALASQQSIPNNLPSQLSTYPPLVPYHTSSLTTILRDSLGGGSSTIFVMSLGAIEYASSDTLLSSLYLGSLARGIINRPVLKCYMLPSLSIKLGDELKFYKTIHNLWKHSFRYVVPPEEIERATSNHDSDFIESKGQLIRYKPIPAELKQANAPAMFVRTVAPYCDPTHIKYLMEMATTENQKQEVTNTLEIVSWIAEELSNLDRNRKDFVSFAASTVGILGKSHQQYNDLKQVMTQVQPSSSLEGAKSTEPVALPIPNGNHSHMNQNGTIQQSDHGTFSKIVELVGSRDQGLAQNGEWKNNPYQVGRTTRLFTSQIPWIFIIICILVIVLTYLSLLHLSPMRPTRFPNLDFRSVIPS